MTEKRFIYTTTINTDRKGYRKDYIWDNETLLHTEQIVGILNQQDKEIRLLKKENKRLAKNLKTAKNNVDANFKSAQYWRQKFEAIPENIRMVWTE